ncbi:MAG: fused MFS/spermidine synthase [Vicinamibacteria bacterium]|nr:fused MFS/spermidine synthase [Vicinamibacteria bacterium]
MPSLGVNLDTVAIGEADIARSGRLDRMLVMSAFFFSGVAAILYQIVWQRALFTIFGTASESVALVVTAFMLGLGLGSLAGGALSIRAGVKPLLAFGLIEAGIGLFGFVSLGLMRWIGLKTVTATGFQIWGASFLSVLLPTLLMGATLPLLSAYFVRPSKNVGASVGDLYSANTLGSALGAVAAGQVLLARLGETGAVRLAAVINIVVAACILARQALEPRR